MKNRDNDFSAKVKPIRRAYGEFLKVPIFMVIGLIALAFGISWLDHSGIAWIEAIRSTIILWLLSNPDATSSLLGTMAAGMLTVTSITISLLLIALQQAAASLTPQVFDQFLRRLFNQLFFGFFIGLCIFLLLTLASADKHFNPVLGAMAGLILTTVALVSLLLVLYSTIEQMRPVNIIDAIHDLVLSARQRQVALLQKTRRDSRFEGKVTKQVYAKKHGCVTYLNLETINHAAESASDEVEVVLNFSIGSFIANGDCLATIKANNNEDAEIMCTALHWAVNLEIQRNIALDPNYGILQLEMIAWTSISTAKSNPDPGLLTLYALRDILSCMVSGDEQKNLVQEVKIIPVVLKDNTLNNIMDSYESLIVVASESMQHQTFTEIIHELNTMYPRLPEELQQEICNIVLRSMSALGEHVPSRVLSEALTMLINTLRNDGQNDTADIVEKQLNRWQSSLNSLNSRATRARPES